MALKATGGLFRYDMVSREEHQVSLAGLVTPQWPIHGDVSPGGKRLAVDVRDSVWLTSRVAIYDTSTGRLTPESPTLPDGRELWGTSQSEVNWSPDGTTLAFVHKYRDCGSEQIHTKMKAVELYGSGREWLIAKNGDTPAWPPTAP